MNKTCRNCKHLKPTINCSQSYNCDNLLEYKIDEENNCDYFERYDNKIMEDLEYLVDNMLKLDEFMHKAYSNLSFIIVIFGILILLN